MMTIRHYLLLAICVLAPSTAANAQQLPAWWYPLGNPEGTRNNPVQLDSAQNAASLAIKWRNTRLKGSPTLLVGALATGSTPGAQQVVGASGSDVIVLGDRGLARSSVAYGDRFLTPARVVLTGLFNTSSLTPRVGQRPTQIGIGVDRKPRDVNDELYCFLADADARPTKQAIPFVSGAENANVGIYPLFRADGNMFMAVTLNSNAGQNITANTIRKYKIAVGTGPNELLWQYPAAPRLYPQQPALLIDPSNKDTGTYMGLGTLPYTAGGVYASLPPNADRTFSNEAYSITIRDDTTNGRKDYGHIETIRRPDEARIQASESNTYFMVLQTSPGNSADYYRLITDEYDGRPGRVDIPIPTLRLRHAFKATPDSIRPFRPGNDSVAASNRGWTIATADIDGTQPDRTVDAVKAVNNTGEEILAAYRNLDGSEVVNNTLWALRLNALDKFPNDSIPLTSFVRYPFSGRLMAVGHLVRDTVGNNTNVAKQEVLIAHRDTLRVLRLLDYDNSVFDRQRPEASPYFEVLATFQLDSVITSVAIADVDGDRLNDIVVGTTGSTYCIGTPLARPFDSVHTDSASYCGTGTIRVYWNRTFGGDQAVRIRIVGTDGAEKLSVVPPVHTGPDPLNVGAGPDSVDIPTDGLRPGTYRAIVSDPSLQHIADTTSAFTIGGATIENFTVGASTPAFGEPIPISATVGCADEVRLVRSIDGGEWDTIAVVPVDGSTADAADTVQCPGDLCNAPESITVRYRYVDKWGITTSAERSVQLVVPSEALAVGSPMSGAVRERVVSWPADLFPCGIVHVDIAAAGTDVWSTVASLSNPSAGSTTFLVPDSLGGTLRLRLCCSDGTGAVCRRGLASFEIPPLPSEGFVAPNPFSPARAPGETWIYYKPRKAGPVSVTIYDAGRAAVATLVSNQVQEARFQRARWDGTNSRGEIVAAGTYICVIESSNEQTILPIIVGNR